MAARVTGAGAAAGKLASPSPGFPMLEPHAGFPTLEPHPSPPSSPLPVVGSPPPAPPPGFSAAAAMDSEHGRRVGVS